MTLYHESDQFMEERQDLLCGRMMSQWWDKTEQAGPSSRAAEPFSQSIPQLDGLSVTDGEVKFLGLYFIKWFSQYKPISSHQMVFSIQPKSEITGFVVSIYQKISFDMLSHSPPGIVGFLEIHNARNIS